MEKTLGQKLADAINERGLSQQEVAKRAGIFETSLNSYIADAQVPTGPVIAKIARVLDITPESLLGDHPIAQTQEHEKDEKNEDSCDVRYPDKYVVILELDGGYMDCIAICDTSAEAYGKAYLALSDCESPDDYYITLPEYREGENGMIISRKSRKTGKEDLFVTVLFYREEEG